MAEDRLSLLLEAERRGLEMSPDDQALLAEARERGMVPKGPSNDPSFMEQAGRLGSILLGQGNKGLTQMTGAMVDPVATAVTNASRTMPFMGFGPSPQAVSQVAELFGGEEAPAPESARPVASVLQPALEEAGTFGPEPETQGERFIGRIGEEMGAASLPIGGLAGTATRAGGPIIRSLPRIPGAIRQAFNPPRRAASNMALRNKDASTRTERVADYLQAPFREAPARTIGAEFTAAAGSGAGRQAAIEGGAEEGSAGDIAGGIAGGVSTSGALTLGRMLKNLATRFRPQAGAPARAQEEVGDILLNNRETPVRSEMDLAAQATSDERGVPFTTAQASGDPGLAGLELDRRASGGRTAGAFREFDRGQEAAFEQSLNRAAPEGNPAATQAELRRRREQALGTARGQEETRAARRDETLADVQPEMTATESGQAIRGARSEELTAAREQERALWRQVQGQADMTPLQQRAQNIIAAQPQARREEVPELIRRIAQGEEGGLFSAQDDVENLAAIRSRLREEADLTESANQKRLLNDAADAADEVLRGTREGLTDPDAARAFDQATQFSKELNDRFTRGPMGRLGQENRRTGQRVADSDVAAEFFRGNKASPERLDQFEAAVGGRPEARKALREGARIDALERNLVNEKGQVNTNKLQTWINSNEEVLNRFPELREDLGSVQSAEHFLRSAQKRRQILEGTLTPRSESKLRTPSTGGRTRAELSPKQSTVATFLDPEEAKDGMANILNSSRPQQEADNLMRLIRHDEDAVRGAQKAFFQLMEEGPSGTAGQGIRVNAETARATDTVLQYRQLRDFLEANDKVAKRIFKDNPEHLERLKSISEDMQRAAFTKGETTGKPVRQIPLRGAGAYTIPQIWSRMYSIQRGVVGVPYVAVETAARLGRRVFNFYGQKHIDQLLDEALLDKDLAKTLMMDAARGKRRVLGRRLRTYLLNDLLVEPEGQMTEDELPEETPRILQNNEFQGPDNLNQIQPTGGEQRE